MNAYETGILEIPPSAFVWVITTCVAQSQSRYYELVPKIKAEHCQNHYNQFLKKWRLAGAVEAWIVWIGISRDGHADADPCGSCG